jgi:[acyl-carrier-protein] S-malonyltransferase
VAIIHVLEQELGITAEQWRMVSGHSLGEYTALHTAGVITLAQSLELIKARGLAMATIKNGGMLAVIGLSHDVISAMTAHLNQEGIECTLANDNSPQQSVLSAASVHLPLLAERARALGAIKSVILNVSGPFHSPMMRSAQDAFSPLLDITPFCPPQCPIVTNISGKEQTNPMIIKDHARQQMTNSVLWRSTQLTMAAASVTYMVEIGAGKVLSGLAKKTIPHVKIHALNSIEAMNQWQEIWNIHQRHPCEALSAVGGG